MNIALFTEMEKVDGQGRFMLLQARWLAQHGHKVVVFSPVSPVLEGAQGYDITHVPIGSVRQAAPLEYEELVGDTARLVRECDKHAIDAMIATAKLPYLMARAALAGMPVFIPVLSDTYFLPPTPANTAEMRKAAQEGRIIGYSFDTIGKHAQEFGFDYRAARYCAFPMDDRMREPKRKPADVRRELGIAPDEIMVLTICRLDVDKVPAIPALGRAADVVAQRTGRKVRLVVTGDGTLAQQTRANTPPSALFLGTRHDIADLYHACDIYAGESTTVLEAAVARRPVIMTCASFHPQFGDKAFGIYGLHSLDYAYTAWSNHAPPTSFEEALLHLVSDADLRNRAADFAHKTVMERNHVDKTMPWLVEVLAGRPCRNRLFGEDAAVVIAVPGGATDGIDALGELCHERGDALRLGVHLDDPLPWGRTLAMPAEHLRAIALAVRRFTNDTTPRARFSAGHLVASDDFPHGLRQVFEEIEKRLPPTSLEPKFALDPPRPLHAVFAGSIDAAIDLLRGLETEADGVAVVWLPSAGTDPGASTFMARLEENASCGVILIGEPLAWTIIGRLIGTVKSYRDDGSTWFTNHRRLARELGIAVVDTPALQ